MNGAPGPGDDPGGRRYFADVLSFGWVLDKLFGLFPVLTAAVGFLGLVAGLRQIYRESGVLSRDGKGPGNGPS